ncbi:hypothetical protein GH714_042450 [Hevea brasiliensis]|uniref:Uncharacterized protein n=1 Tax=Hevea brasiliensis TaxID=3981 RepID=A0A6A6M3S1_HEVBR|nr:hypothetical protein GH714_042450 [Hevea brasiliensis]
MASNPLSGSQVLAGTQVPVTSQVPVAPHVPLMVRTSASGFVDLVLDVQAPLVALVEVSDTSDTNSGTLLSTNSYFISDAFSERHSGTYEEAQSLVPFESNHATQEVANVGDDDDPLEDIHLLTFPKEREKEDRVKDIRGKMTNLEEQISRIKAKITELKAEETSLMWLEDD